MTPQELWDKHRMATMIGHSNRDKDRTLEWYIEKFNDNDKRVALYGPYPTHDAAMEDANRIAGGA